MALWNTVGDLLQASGWSTALTEAEVASPGVAESFMKATPKENKVMSECMRIAYFLYV